MYLKSFYTALIASGVLLANDTAAQSLLSTDSAERLLTVNDHDHDHEHEHGQGFHTDENTFDFVEFGKWDLDRSADTAVVPGVGVSLTYSFVTSDSVRQINTNRSVIPISEALPNFSENEIRSAFTAWSDVANITFTEIMDSGLDHFEDLDAGRLESGADIRIGAFALDGPGSLRARTNIRSVMNDSTDLREFRGSIVTFDLDENWVVDAIDGDRRTLDVFNVAAHEIGHVIGLNHSGVTGSLMDTASAATETFRGPQADDIAGAQFLYGPPATSAIPEPTSGWLITLAATCVSLVRRRREG